MEKELSIVHNPIYIYIYIYYYKIFIAVEQEESIIYRIISYIILTYIAGEKEEDKRYSLLQNLYCWIKRRR